MIEFLEGYEDYFEDWLWEMTIASLLTLELMLFAFILSCILGLFIALLRISKNRILSQFSKIYIGFFRGVPVLVILYWIYFALPELGYEFLMISSFTAAILGMGIHGSAFMAEVFRSGIQALNIGQMEASLSLGMTPLNALRFIILPQAIRIGLPPTANFAVGLLKETALCSIIAVPELMLRAKDVASSSFLPMQAFVMAAVFYYIMSFPMMRLVDYLERRMGKSSLS
jgi:His/Glu/Gln/Arg/opine family amino acid ABC transporter permease subunit